jgi:Family of unknown function (DUF6152)
MCKEVVMSTRWTLVLLVAGAAALGAGAATAHHGWSGQRTEQFELTGTLYKAVSLAGPHATMQIEDDMGQVWDITLAPPSRTKNAGLTEDAIPLGATVTVSGHRSGSADRYEIKTERVIYGERKFDVYPGRL